MTVTTVVDGLDHPEGVAWGPDGHLYAGGEAGQIYKIDVEAGTVDQIATTGGFVLGLAIDRDNNVYACDSELRAVVRVTPEGAVSEYSSGSQERPMQTPNYPVFDRYGNLYVSDSGSWPEGGGCIFRVSPDGKTEVWSTEVARFANGLALSPDGGILYVVESTLPGVSRIPLNEDGSAGQAEPVVELPGTVPDGIAFDVEGRLFISCYRPDRIYTFDPDAGLQILAEDPLGTALAAPTNIAFGRGDLSTLFIASLGRWHISQFTTKVPGAPLNYPSLLHNTSSTGRR
jgi:gluconolactonase